MTKDLAWSFTTATPTFQDNVVLSGLYEPTNIQWASGWADPSSAQKTRHHPSNLNSLSDTTPTTVADLNVETHDFWDKGLVGMALDPQFPTRPYMYILYHASTTASSADRIAEVWLGSAYSDEVHGPQCDHHGALRIADACRRITLNPTTNVMVAGSEAGAH